MSIYITHNSALQYWRLVGKARTNLGHRQRRTLLPLDPPDISFLRSAGDVYTFGSMRLSLPLDILVATSSARRPSKVITPHVFSGTVPENSFINVGRELFVSSPELCFLLMASKLSLIELIELGFEFCGSYSLPAAPISHLVDDKIADKALYNLPELTNVKKLMTFIERTQGVIGHYQASRALRHIANDSGSPMETILTMLLTLPYKLGGYSLPMPSLNHPVSPIKQLKGSTNRSHFRCDLFWPDRKLAVEYDSEMFHDNARKIAEDAVRRNILTALNITPITVTKQQLYSTPGLERVAMQLASKLGRQLKHRKPGFAKAHSSLRKALL